MDDRFARLREIVEHALGLDPAEREAWIDANSAADDRGDGGMRRCALLQSPLSPTSPTSSPRRARFPRRGRSRIGPVSPHPPPRHGRHGHRLRGGTRGSPSGASRSRWSAPPCSVPEAAARFRYEVEVLARLQHPAHRGHVRVRRPRRRCRGSRWSSSRSAQPLVTYAQGLELRARIALFLDVVRRRPARTRERRPAPRPQAGEPPRRSRTAPAR